MRKKIFFAIATSFFAVATVFNMGILQSGNTSDVSLESIAVMAQAQSGESNELPEVTVYGISVWKKTGVCEETGYDIYECVPITTTDPSDVSEC